MQRERRRDPYRWAWEHVGHLVVVLVSGLVFSVGATAGQPAAASSDEPGDLAVAAMTLSQPTTSTMQVAWRPAPGAAPETTYKIGWTEAGTGRTWDTQLRHYPAHASPVTLTGLIPSARYAVHITPSLPRGGGRTARAALSTAPATTELPTAHPATAPSTVQSPTANGTIPPPTAPTAPTGPTAPTAPEVLAGEAPGVAPSTVPGETPEAANSSSGQAPEAPTISEPGVASSAPAPAAIPDKVIEVYWQMFHGPDLPTVQANSPDANVFAAAFALGDGTGGGGVTFSVAGLGSGYNSDEDFHRDLAASQATGDLWLLSIGGGTDTGIHVLNEAQAQQMVDCLIPIIDHFGFNGVDWDLEGGPGQWTPQALTSASLKLKAHYGDDFVITAAPRQYEEDWRTWARLMGDDLAWLGYQFYDFPETRDQAALNTIINDRINADTSGAQPIAADKIVIGTITDTTYPLGWQHLSGYQDIIAGILKNYPDLRGAFCWEASSDQNEGWTFARGMKTTFTPYGLG